MGALLWIRKTWRWVLPSMLVLQVLAMVNVQPVDETNPLPGWRVDGAWMLSVWSGATLLLSPVGAAITAALVLREFPREVQRAVAPLRRGWRPILHIASAVGVQGLAAQVSTLIGGVAICWANSADFSGVTLPWQLLTGPAALIAAVSMGAGIGFVFPSPWSVPITAFGMFLAHRALYWWGFPELFTTEMATWMMTGLRPIPAHLAATVALNAVTTVAVWAIVVHLSETLRIRRRLPLIVAALAIAAAAAAYLPFVLEGAVNTYEPIP